MDLNSLPTRSASPLPGRPGNDANLADILERVLDKGIVIAGDIQINLLDIELLTIKLRLLVASVDRAKEMGIDWWESDPGLTSGACAGRGQRPSSRRAPGCANGSSPPCWTPPSKHPAPREQPLPTARRRSR